MLFDDKRWKMPEIPTPGLEPWQKILLDAADLLETKGWTRGAYDRDDRYCAIGAINVASGFPAGTNSSSYDSLKDEYKLNFEAKYKLTQYLQQSSITSWNDRQTKKETVIAALRAAAKQ